MIKKNNAPKEDLYRVSYENYLDTNACTECTGLIPAEADGRKEWNNYREIFDFMPQTSSDEDIRQ